MKKIFTILSVVSLTTFFNAQELLTNPGFESDLTGWSAGPNTAYTAPVVSTTDFHSGAKSVGYSAATATTGFYQNVNVTAGKTYVISFWYKATGDDTDARLWSIYKTAAGSTGTAVYTTADATTDTFRTNNGYLAPSSVWKQYTAEMPAGTGATVLEVAVRVYNGTVIAQFDDFSVMEKTTMAVSDVKDFDKQVKMNTLVDNQLTLRLPGRSTVNVYSIDGRLVSSNRVSDGESVNMQGVQKGNYIVTVDNGSAKISRKIIKQ